MSERSPIPNLPPLSGVQDPAVRSYLEALSQAWLVRNGQTRETDERFLTVRDLREGIQQAVRGGSGGFLNGAGGGNPTQGVIASAIQSLIDDIQQSRLWRLLGERIQQIEMPEWFRGRFGAEIRTEVIKQESARSALASEVTTAVANINGNISIAKQEIKAVSDQAGATASAVTTLQTTVNNTTTVAQQAFSLAQSIDGQVDGAWTVKFDANGYVTGAGLGIEGKNGSYSSEFTVRADRFSIGAPANPSAMGDVDVPFVVTATTRTINGVTYPPGTWIKTSYIADATIGSAKIADASITNAKIANAAVGTAQIQDLSVDTLKIRNNAVSYVSRVNGTSITVTAHGPSSMFILGKAYLEVTNQGDLYLENTYNNTTVLIDRTSAHGGGNLSGAATVCAAVIVTPPGNTQITFSIRSTGASQMNNPVIVVMEVMK